jgi:hypothetical protein
VDAVCADDFVMLFDFRVVNNEFPPVAVRERMSSKKAAFAPLQNYGLLSP